MADQVPEEVRAAFSSTPQTEGPGLFSRLTQAAGRKYRDIATPINESAAQFFSNPFAAKDTDRKPGPLAKFAAGMVVPTDPVMGAINLATLGLGPKVKAASEAIKVGGRVIRPLVRGAFRTAFPTAVGAGSAALTGEDPKMGAAKGLITGLGGEALQAGFRAAAKKAVPTTTENLSQLFKEEGPQYVQSITKDIPALSGIVRSYDDLLTLANPKVSKQVGDAIYNPVKQALSGLNIHFTFPYLRGGGARGIVDVLGTGRMNLPPTVSELLPPKTQAILRRAGGLSANEAMEVIQQLKEVAYGVSEGAIGRAAGNFAKQVEEDFISTLRNNSPVAARLYENAKSQYSAFKGFQEVIRKNPNLFESGGLTPGLNPAAWRTALVKHYATGDVSESQIPRFMNKVFSGGMGLGAGATMERASIPVRFYHSFPGVGHLLRMGESVPSEKVIRIPTPVPSGIKARMLPPSVVSGVQSALTPEQRKKLPPWAQNLTPEDIAKIGAQ